MQSNVMIELEVQLPSHSPEHPYSFLCGPFFGGVLTPKKTKKNQKKPSQFTNFGVATGFFWFFFGFFWFFLVFFGFFWYFLVFLVFFGMTFQP